MKVDEGIRTRMRELARLQSKAARTLAKSDDPRDSFLRHALALCEALAQDALAAYEQRHEMAERLATAEADWASVFEEMPHACVCTDRYGTVLKANTAAGTLLNTSAPRLDTRLLMHYVEDREEFSGMLRSAASADGVVPAATLVVRPRERAALTLDVMAIARWTGDPQGVLWFFSYPQPKAGR